jgi:hypothetical protein
VIIAVGRAGDVTPIVTTPDHGLIVFGGSYPPTPLHSSGIFALDAASGRQLWTFKSPGGLSNRLAFGLHKARPDHAVIWNERRQHGVRSQPLSHEIGRPLTLQIGVVPRKMVAITNNNPIASVSPSHSLLELFNSVTERARNGFRGSLFFSTRDRLYCTKCIKL